MSDLRTATEIHSVRYATAWHFHIKVDDLTSKVRTEQFVIARHVAWYLERKLWALSYPQIGNIYDRDHSGVMAGIKHVAERVAALDMRYVPAIDKIEAMINRQRDEVEPKTVLACPTCGTNIFELRRQLDLMQRRLDELGAKP